MPTEAEPTKEDRTPLEKDVIELPDGRYLIVYRRPEAADPSAPPAT